MKDQIVIVGMEVSFLSCLYCMAKHQSIDDFNIGVLPVAPLVVGGALGALCDTLGIQ